MIEQRMGEVASASIPLATMADIDLGHGHSWRVDERRLLRRQLLDDEPLARRLHWNGGDGLDSDTHARAEEVREAALKRRLELRGESRGGHDTQGEGLWRGLDGLVFPHVGNDPDREREELSESTGAHLPSLRSPDHLDVAPFEAGQGGHSPSARAARANHGAIAG